ncbi:hypothetical protein Hanom_Chr03g00221101 [Helianthus anomalus]
MCHLMIKYSSDFSLDITRVSLYILCTNMNLVVGSIRDTIHVINEHANPCHILYVSSCVLLECGPYEFFG